MSELAILYATAGKIPPRFAKNVLEHLKNAAGDYPVIEVRSTPEESSIVNYYRELLRAAKAADSDYIAIAEDDTLYPDEHFNYRPPADVFAYNFTRWNIHTWSIPPFFSLRQRKILATLIVSRELFIETITERFAHDPLGEHLKWWGEPGRPQHEKGLGVTLRKSQEFMTYNPIVVFSHPNSFGYEGMGKHKRANKIRALELPYWGKASEIAKLYIK